MVAPWQRSGIFGLPAAATQWLGVGALLAVARLLYRLHTYDPAEAA